MPYCKNCHKEIARFDQDVCPYCGVSDPIESSYQTMDQTMFIPKSEGGPLYQSKSRKTYLILCMTLGYLGIHNFYVKKWLLAVIDLLILVLATVGIGLIFFFTFMPNAGAFLIPFGVVWLFFLVEGIILSKYDSLRDGEGEFLH